MSDFDNAKILIGIPHLGDYVPIPFIQSLESLKKSKYTKKLWVTHTITSAARNIIAHYAINHGYDYVFFMDSDMTFHPETLKELYENQKDIVGGMYMIRRHSDEIYIGNNWNDEKKKFFSVERFDLSQKFFHVDAMGTGCLLIKTNVFKAMRKPWFFYNDGLPENMQFIETAGKYNHESSKSGEITIDMTENCGYNCGEDFNFFRRVMLETDFYPVLNTTVYCGHLTITSRGQAMITKIRKEEPVQI